MSRLKLERQRNLVIRLNDIKKSKKSIFKRNFKHQSDILNKISYEEGLNFMLCFENAIKKFDKNINKSLKECVKGEDLYNNIINCAESSVGNNLQHIEAQKTPVHKYVPFIYVNGKHDLEVEKKILKEFVYPEDD